MLSILATVILFILIIGVVVFVHELGHFLAAKKTGMEVQEFSMGMGPRLWSVKKGGTEYMIKLFPIGGYVKILGEEERVKNKGSFSEKSVGSRMLVAFAGVIMNLLLAVVLFSIVLFAKDFSYVGLPYYEDFHVVFGQQNEVYAYPPTVITVMEDTPAQEAGLEGPFEILSVDGAAVETVEDVQLIIQQYPGEEVVLEIKDMEGEVAEVSVGVSEDGKIGVELAPDMVVWEIVYSGWERPVVGFLHSANMIKANVFILGKLFSQAVEERTVAPVAQSVTGPIGLFAIIDVVREYGGLIGLLDLVALFCLALVLMNMLPLPALDGGHVLFLSIEAVRGRPVDEKIQQALFGAGMVFLIALMVVISVKDIFQFGVWDWVKDLFSA